MAAKQGLGRHRNRVSWRVEEDPVLGSVALWQIISSDAPPDHPPARVRPCDMFMNFPTEMRWATTTRSTPR